MTSRSLKIALAVSVALNVFAVAAGAAVWVVRDKIEDRVAEARGRSRLETGAVETLNQLSPADRKALAPILSRHKPKREARKPEKADKPVAPVAAASAAR